MARECLGFAVAMASAAWALTRECLAEQILDLPWVPSLRVSDRARKAERGQTMISRLSLLPIQRLAVAFGKSLLLAFVLPLPRPPKPPLTF